VSHYVYARADAVEADRLRSLEEMFDPNTTRRLAALGAVPGARVLEVGFGGGSVARWLAERVGPDGRVVATDLDIQHLASADVPNLEVRRHDLLNDPLEPGAYDLVHARAVLEHLEDPAAGLDRLVRAVRPGGALVVEDVDFGPEMVAALSPLALRAGAPRLVEDVTGAIRAVFQRAGARVDLGRTLPGRLAAAGLREVSAEMYAPMTPASVRFVRLTTVRLREPILATGLVTVADVDAMLAITDDPDFRPAPLFMVTAWGRRA
jgi:2-polyprenyl-3-methyl-5-hydroxy-6-metoxy-1,4-benzoquinol methylase